MTLKVYYGVHFTRKAKLKQHGSVFKGLYHEIIIKIIISVIAPYLISLHI